MIKKSIHFFCKKKRPDFLPDSIKNYNFEQFKGFSKYYKKAIDQKDLLIKKLDHKNFKKSSKKEIDMDITNYNCWRVFEVEEKKHHHIPFEIVTTGKIKTTPKQFVDAFGYPNHADHFHRRSLGFYIFQDGFNNFYEVMDYKSEKELEIISENVFEGLYKEFWNSEKEDTFRIAVSYRAPKHKFLAFLLDELKKVEENPEDTFYNKMVKKFGEPQLFDNYEENYEEKRIPLVFTHSRKEFEKLAKSDLTFIEDTEYDTLPKMQKDLRNETDVEIKNK